MFGIYANVCSAIRICFRKERIREIAQNTLFRFNWIKENQETSPTIEALRIRQI